MALKLGVIGCGEIVQLVHFNILTSLADASVAAFADPDPQRRQAAGRRAPRAIACNGYQELLALPEVEAVLICAPSGLHAEMALAALRSGKHVYLEKPLATSLEEGRQVLAAWRLAANIGMIGFNYRFHPLYRAVRQYLREGRIGELIGARAVMSAALPSTSDWRTSRRLGGGALLELASHHVDLIHFLFDQEVREVYAEVRSQRSEDDSAMLQLRLRDGLSVQLFVSLQTVEEDRFEIYGQTGKLTVDRHRSLRVAFAASRQDRSRIRLLREGIADLMRNGHAWDRLRSPQREPSYRSALVHFVTAVQERRAMSPDLWDGYRSLAVLAAAQESARTRHAVTPRYTVE